MCGYATVLEDRETISAPYLTLSLFLFLDLSLSHTHTLPLLYVWLRDGVRRQRNYLCSIPHSLSLSFSRSLSLTHTHSLSLPLLYVWLRDGIRRQRNYLHFTTHHLSLFLDISLSHTHTLSLSLSSMCGYVTVLEDRETISTSHLTSPQHILHKILHFHLLIRHFLF